MTSVFIRLALVWACLCGFASSAFATCNGSPMSNGWCWPLAVSSWGGALGWHGGNSDFSSSGSHLAKDIMASEGSSVYAVSRGIVLIVRNDDVNFYGGAEDPGCSISKPKSKKGSGVVIRHYTADKKPFEVLYAHLKNVSVQRGDVVEAGASIAQVRDYTWCGDNKNHLHLGVVFPARDLSTYGSSGTGDVWAGYGTTDRGFVNPESFFATQSVGDIAPCDPSKERCYLRKNGPSGGLIGWYPPVENCEQASQWFKLSDTDSQTSRAVSTTKDQCPQACYVN